MFSPLEQFEILPLFDFFLTFSNVFLILLLGFSFFFFFIILKKELISNLYNQLFEIIYNITKELSYSNINGKGNVFFSLIFVIFNFILICNLIGMIPYSFTVTSHLIITFCFAFAIYLGFNIIGIRKHKLKFLNLLLPSGSNIYLIFLLIPIELISYIFRVISLPVRLFANMMAGHTLLKIIAGFAWTLANSSFLFFLIHFIPLILLVILFGLELGVALIQTYVFTILICIYINDALNLH